MDSIKYYKQNAKRYIDESIEQNLQHLYDEVLPLVKKGGSILDVGFGSGRDMLFCKQHGFEVYGLDPVEEFVLHAKDINLDNTYVGTLLNFETSHKFDLIWANASLLHSNEETLTREIKSIKNILNTGGIVFLSFKHGSGSYVENEREFFLMNEEKIHTLSKVCGFTIKNIFYTKDSKGRKQDWINIILS